MLKFLKLNLDLNNFIYESIICIVVRQGNRIYKKLIADKYYKFWKKFKNATKAKRFIKRLELGQGIQRFERLKNLYISSKPI